MPVGGESLQIVTSDTDLRNFTWRIWSSEDTSDTQFGERLTNPRYQHYESRYSSGHNQGTKPVAPRLPPPHHRTSQTPPLITLPEIATPWLKGDSGQWSTPMRSTLSHCDASSMLLSALFSCGGASRRCAAARLCDTEPPYRSWARDAF